MNVSGEGETGVQEYDLFSGLLSLDGGAFEWDRREIHCEGRSGVHQNPSRAIEKKVELLIAIEKKKSY